MNELVHIQSELKAPKTQFNTFGGYKYRSAEDILEAVKPLLAKYDCTLTISDDIIQVADRIYVRAEATITNKDGQAVTTHALAREEEAKKGMDASQITGTASSYARKYALNGLFAIDDTKDADATNDHGKTTKPEPVKTTKPVDDQPTQEEIDTAVADVYTINTIAGLKDYWGKNEKLHAAHAFTAAMTARKNEIAAINNSTK